MQKIDTVKLFCEVDDFVQHYQEQSNQKIIQSSTKKRNRPTRLSMSERMTILILFHTSGYRNFKTFYQGISLLYPSCFPTLVSYHRFVELVPATILPLCALLESRKGTCTGISFIDSTPICVCKPKRMARKPRFQRLCNQRKVDYWMVFWVQIASHSQ